MVALFYAGKLFAVQLPEANNVAPATPPLACVELVAKSLFVLTVPDAGFSAVSDGLAGGA